ncbi:MAG: hypothetical protein VX608_13230 [Chloroflexota bacterium]|nr:hypothetical protein [Chloroflexota bacterium]
MGRTLMEVEAKMTTVGSGDYTYTLIENWAKLPAGETWGNTSAVATDSQDRVYVFQRKDPPVMIFDRDGNFLNSWGISAITDPHGIFIEDDIIYLTDRADSVALKFTLDGKALQVIGRRGVHSNTECEIAGELVPRRLAPSTTPRSWFPHPRATCTFPTVTATPGFTASRPTGGCWRHGESRGRRGPTNSTCPTASWWTPAVWFTCATGKTTVSRVFTGGGRFITMWTGLRRPLDISSDADGILHISEGGVGGMSPRVSLMTKQGQLVAR